MSKPVWEEEWTADDNVLFNADFADESMAVFDARGAAYPEAAKLASAAPDMARLLLRLENAEAEHAYCRTCYGSGGTLPPQGGFTKGSGHKPDCEWLRVMKKAGVR